MEQFDCWIWISPVCWFKILWLQGRGIRVKRLRGRQYWLYWSLWDNKKSNRVKVPLGRMNLWHLTLNLCFRLYPNTLQAQDNDCLNETQDSCSWNGVAASQPEPALQARKGQDSSFVSWICSLETASGISQTQAHYFLPKLFPVESLRIITCLCKSTLK